MNVQNFTFAPLKADQESLIIDWLHRPHVNEWYHGEGLQNTIKGIQTFLSDQANWFDAWVGYCGGSPFAFLMTFSLAETDRQDPECHQAKWMEKGKKTMGLDLLIGDENYLGKGLAVPLIQSFIDQVYHEVDSVFIDPECANTKAVHVYKKAGFDVLEEFIASWHPVPHVLMRLKR